MVCNIYLKLQFYLQSGDRDAKYQDYLDYLATLGPNECRYGLYDFEYDQACEGAAEVSIEFYCTQFLIGGTIDTLFR